MKNKVIEGLKRLEERLSRYGMPWRHEKDIVSDAIKCVELMPELVDVLDVSEKVLFSLTDICNCYEDYICQSCRGSDAWRKVDKAIKKAKEMIE